MMIFMRQGQVTVLALLLGLLGLTISLSAASRSLSDFHQVTVVDQGTKALAAAEAGVQYGLNQLSVGTLNCPGPTSANIPLAGIKGYDAINPKNTGVSYSVCSSTDPYVTYSAVAQDDVVQMNLQKVNNAVNLRSFYVLWKNPNSALEIEKIDNAGVATRWSFNGIGISSSTNNFAPALAVAGSNIINSTCGDSSFNGGSWTGFDVIPFVKPPPPSNPTDLFLRIKPIYQATDVVVCGYTTSGSAGPIDLQFYQITATATSSGGVTRKIRTKQIYSFLPAIFDNVFYSGGSLTK